MSQAQPVSSNRAAADRAAISSLLADLNVPTVSAPSDPVTDVPAASTTTVIAANPDAGADDGTNHDLESVLAKLDAAEPAAADKPAKGKGKGKGKNKAAAPATGEPAADPAAAAPKPAKIPRIHFANKIDRIKHRLGEELGDYLVLELADAELTDDALSEKQAETMVLLESMNVKEKNRANFLFDFMAEKKADLNGVMETAFRLLAADGELTTGDNGNLHQKLLAKPYAPGSARATGRNTVNVMERLKVIVKSEKQKFLPNPNSVILMKVNALLGLGE